MKNNLKKIRILLIMLFALFFSCEKDLYENAINQEKNGYKFKSIKLSEVKKHNIKTSNAINKLQNYSENASLRTTEAYGKIIDTTNVIYLVKENGFESFTFKILQTEGLHYFENIVVNNYPNGNIEILSVKFNLNKSLEQVKVQNNLLTSQTTTEVSKYNTTTNTFERNGGCVEVGYYETVDRCQGELVTPEEKPKCFNADGTKAQVQVFVVVASDCDEGVTGGGDSSGGVIVGGPYGPGNTGGGTGGSGNNGNTGTTNTPNVIFIPNPYEGDPDPSNASFVFAGKVSTFLNTLKINNPVIQNILTSNYWVYPAIVDFMRNNDGLTLENKDAVSFALNNIETVFNSIYQNSNNLSESEINQLKYKAFIFLLNNPRTTSEKYLNWFLGRVEGKDSFYNDSFWQNSNLNFPQQQLPTWNDFNNSFPRNSDGTLMTGADNVFGYVGGSVLQARIDNPDTTNNTCALKVSIALNGSGVVIPNIPGQTLEGGSAFAGKFFFLNAKALNNWMKLTFGTNPSNPNHHQFNQDQGGTNGEGFVSALNDLQPNHGIFTMLPISAIEFGASGHCDIFDGTNCGSHCYFDSANEINIWILP
jgi:hypothetical protein